ncbi:uncharacterized protein LOC111055921 [Nilaparvata lugens]|uniref:uncharacterized protein LOC111055921 n=1 Tax=Nilaparvata lugens TaxID=108931 RepID=UPI00193DF100|nr:uncharacterized protein LOC111055921 [Nilaparvata lugens]
MSIHFFWSLFVLVLVLNFLPAFTSDYYRNLQDEPEWKEEEARSQQPRENQNNRNEMETTIKEPVKIKQSQQPRTRKTGNGRISKEPVNTYENTEFDDYSNMGQESLHFCC